MTRVRTYNNRRKSKTMSNWDKNGRKKAHYIRQRRREFKKIINSFNKASLLFKGFASAVDEFGNSLKGFKSIYDMVSEETGADRDTVKSVMYSHVYGVTSEEFAKNVAFAKEKLALQQAITRNKNSSSFNNVNSGTISGRFKSNGINLNQLPKTQKYEKE